MVAVLLRSLLHKAAVSMNVRIITRFSIPGGEGFRRPELLEDEERLAHKFRAFYSMTMPSVLSQTRDDWEWHVVAWDKFDGRLALPDDSRIKPHFVSDYKEFVALCRELGNGSNTMRLDDDDALAPDLLERLHQYNGAKANAVIFTHGRKYLLLPIGYATRQKPYIRPSLAIGMTRLNGDIYEWHHEWLPEPVIRDDSMNAWMVCCGRWCDTQRDFYSD